MIDRRTWLAGAGALVAGAAPAPSGLYDYLFLDLAGGRDAFAADLAAARPAIAAAGGEILAIFIPALGWKSDQRAVLVGWQADIPARAAALRGITAAPSVIASAPDRLAATARPHPGDKVPAGGIFVHRWFVIDPKDVDELVRLSVIGWKDYEGQFDTRIYGLFEAARTAADRKAGVTRMLLITRYRDHGAWEESRDPSAASRTAFNQRQKLLKGGWAASTRLSKD